MARGVLTKYEILSKVLRLKDQLRDETISEEQRLVANRYLNEVLEYLKGFTY